MTEHETIAAAAAAFDRRDALKAQMDAVDAEIAELVKHYSQAMRMWGFTPLMLRRAVDVRLGRKVG
jgi:hypothetical protein